MDVCYKECEKIEKLRSLAVHSNTKRCPIIYEVVPVIGCEFQCVYCNALGQEEGKEFLPVQIDINYVSFFREEIKKHREQGIYPLYYYSPKTDCFQKVLLESGITKQILQVFNEFECEYVIVSKGVPTDDVFEEIVKSKERCQVIITYGMPSEEYRDKLEKGAASNEERFYFAEKCVKNNIQTCIILEPILPLADLSFVEEIIKAFSAIHIRHFALDFVRISDVALKNIIEILPECKEQFERVYLDPDADIQNFRTAKGTVVARRAPSKRYILERFMEFKEIAKKYGSTVSACNSFGFDEFNEDANKAGYQCMGIKLRNQ